MADRTDVLTALYYLLIVLAAYVLASIPNLSANPAAGYAGLVALFLIFIVPVVWAFNIRRALAVRLYRNQALGVALFSAGLPTALYGGFAGTSVFAVFIFYLVDASALSGRRSDPLLRDSLQWSKARYPAWAAVLLVVIPELVDSFFKGTYLTHRGTPDLLGDISTTLIFVLLGVSVVLLSLVAKRSQDPALRANLAWLGTSLLVVFTGPVLAVNIQGAAGDAAAAAGFALTGFLLYKSATSLVPLNRILSIQDETMKR